MGLAQVNGARKAAVNGAASRASDEEEEGEGAASGRQKRKRGKEKGGRKSFHQANQSKTFFADIL